MRILLAAPSGGTIDRLRELLGKLDAVHDVHVASDSPSVGTSDAPPDLIVVDVDSSPAAAPSIVADTARRYPSCRVVATGTSVDDGFVESVLEAGALGYLPKSFSETLTLGVLRLLLSRAPTPEAEESPDQLAASASDGELASMSSEPKPTGAELDSGLTARQIDVLALAATGKSNQSIAKQLGITEGVVKLHMTAIFKALKVSNRSEAVLLASRIRSVNVRHVKDAEAGRFDLDWLLPHMSHRRMERNAIVFRKGDPGRELFYLQRGTIRLNEIDSEINAGSMFGEIGIFSPAHNRTVTAVCSTEVDLFTLSAEQVKRLYLLNPQFALFTVHLIAKRLMADQARTL